jgi:subtilisin family serine protease
VLTLVAAVVALAVPATMSGADGVQHLLDVQAAGSAEMAYEGTSAWFVELKNGRSAADFRADAKAVNLAHKERFVFEKLWKGLSVEVSSGDVRALEGLRSVAALYPVLTVDAPETSSVSDPELATAIVMTGADIAQDTLGFTGEGVKVAVMDTGIDYDNPALGGDGVTRTDSSQFPNSRVVAGFDFVGDGFNASGSGAALVPNPDPRPDDCNGHGSHVAGIVGADGDVGGGPIKGVAPDVTFGAYRVFGCVGSTTADIMIAAMERALADGMDILNMSIGSAFQTWPQYPTAAASDALVDAGVVVVASIGNSGANGVLSAGAPGVGNKVIGVASYDNSHISALTFDTPDRTGIPYLPIAAVPDPPTSGTVNQPIVHVGQGCNADPYLADPAGKIALIRRGACTFEEKYAKAFNAGAIGVIIANNSPGLFAGGGVVDRGIFLVGISQADGDFLVANPQPSLTWTSNRINAVNPTGGLLSSFTSYGLNAELTLKPDLGAPGGLIRSAYPLELGGAAIISGTSMASPHVAGAAALLVEARPALDTERYRDVLQNSADPKNLSIAPTLGLLDFVHRQGAGMVDIDDSILSTTTVLPGKLSLGEGPGPHAKTLTVSNSGSTSVTYDLSHIAAVDSRPSANAAVIHPFGFSIFFSPATVTFSSPSVTVPAGGSASFEVTISNGLPNLTQYGGYVVLTPQGGGQTYRVPYAGMGGDYQAAVALPMRAPFPAVGKEVAPGSFDLADPTEVWTLQSLDEIPNLLLHFDYQSRRLEVEVVSASSGRKLHPVFSNMHEEDFLPRNSTATSFFAFPWDGTRMHDNGRGTPDHRKVVPDGQYKLVVKVLKALGDPNNPAHWETWTSPTITIDRP